MLMAVDDSSNVLCTMSGDEKGSENRLGPSVLAEIHVNGVPTTALIDTGSPATIISLDYVLSLMRGEREEGQSPEKWRAATLKRFAPPEVSLKNYGGHPLNILSQTKLHLTQGKHAIEATVLVQKGAPNNLLVGTDVQSRLGFTLVMETTGRVMDLLTGGELDLQLPLSTVSEQPKQPQTSSRPIAPFNSGGRQTPSSAGGEEKEVRKNSAVSGLVTSPLPGDAPSTREAVIAPAEIGLGMPRVDQSAFPSQDTLPDNKSPTLPGEVKQGPCTPLHCHHDRVDCNTQHHGRGGGDWSYEASESREDTSGLPKDGENSSGWRAADCDAAVHTWSPWR